MKCSKCGHVTGCHDVSDLYEDQIDLLPCPCCGGKAEFEKFSGGQEWLVRCTVCDLNTVPRTKEETAAQWNKRMPNDPLTRGIPSRPAGVSGNGGTHV